MHESVERVDDFVVARNPDSDSALPYLLRIPLRGRPVILKARETWPRTSKVYCHRADAWPADAEILERVPVVSCVQRGPAVDLVLARGRENRSQLVFTRLKNGRDAIFWQTARTNAKARPGVRVPTARASGFVDLEIVVDRRERYAYRFADQQAHPVPGTLPCGDYGVRDATGEGGWLGVVERKSVEDLARSLVDGRLAGQVAELSAQRRAAVVVEERYSRLLALPSVSASFVLDLLARVQVRWPEVPIFFAETRPLAQEWTYRFLAAAAAEDLGASRLEARLADLVVAPDLQRAAATPAEIRAWAAEHGHHVSPRGRVPLEVRAAHERWVATQG